MSEWDEKSISAEETFFSDLADHARMQAEVLRLADRAGQRMRAQNLATGCVQVKIRRARLHHLHAAEALRTLDHRLAHHREDRRGVADRLARRAAARARAVVRRRREPPARRRPDGPVRRAGRRAPRALRAPPRSTPPWTSSASASATSPSAAAAPCPRPAAATSPPRTCPRRRPAGGAAGHRRHRPSGVENQPFRGPCRRRFLSPGKPV